MILRFSICLFLALAINARVCLLAAPPTPTKRQKPAIKCEMRPWTGKVEAILDGQRVALDSSHAAEVEITNISDADVDIGSKWGPYAHLNLKLKGPNGKDVKTRKLSDGLSTQSLLKPKPYLLKPGKVYLCAVDLLGTVPEEERVIGTYQVQAVYTIANKEYESDWLEVKWTKKK